MKNMGAVLFFAVACGIMGLVNKNLRRMYDNEKSTEDCRQNISDHALKKMSVECKNRSIIINHYEIYRRVKHESC